METYEKAQELIKLIKQHQVTQYRVAKMTELNHTLVKGYQDNEAKLYGATYRNIKKLANAYDEIEQNWLNK